MRRSSTLWFALIILHVTGCGSGTAGDSIAFDPCTTTVVGARVTAGDQLASVDDALAMWRADGITGLVRADAQDAAPDVAIEFRAGAPAVYGFYDDATGTVYVNEALTDRGKRAITIAHELGHALGLVHVSADTRASIMNPGNLTVMPTAGDVAALTTLWGRCDQR